MTTRTVPPINAYLTHADQIVLANLHQDLHTKDAGFETSKDQNDQTLQRLRALNDPTDPGFEPCIFAMYDDKDFSPWFREYLVRPYCDVARRIVRHQTDVVFLTNILWNLFVTLPSAVYLFYNFSWLHGVLHTVQAGWCMGPFTLMMHNHIHNNGVLAKSWKGFDFSFPYLLEPLLGHTWDSYYYHHVKHHHVEGNGPDDLSSTLRYQRDDVFDFLCYESRFIFLVWWELPLYFFKKQKPVMAFKAFASEMCSYAFIWYMTTNVNARAAAFTLLLPLLFMRLAMMFSNWGQHALVDDVDPDHDLRSSITLIDVPSNRFSFNDGYHTAHHLNPLRHWREQPLHFVQQKKTYAAGRALVFRDIDYLMMTVKLLTKNYDHLAEHLVPIGDQMGMSKAEIAAMLRTKTRRLTEDDIEQKFRQKGKATAK